VQTVQIGVESDAETWRSGDCLDWMQGGMPTTTLQHVVPCSAPHLVEVAGTIRVTGSYKSYPTDAEWRAIAQHDCLLPVAALFGGPVAPGYYATALVPLPKKWAQDHNGGVQCGVAKWGNPAPEIDRELSPFVGHVERTAQSRLANPGVCEDADFIPTPCPAPHTHELTGYVDLTGLASTPPTNDDDWMTLVGKRCEEVGRTYLGRQYRSDEFYSFIHITPERWAAGTRAVECFALRGDPSGQAITVTRSLRDG
jgi:hypothetical protein